MKLLKPLSSQDITRLIAEGKTAEILTHTKEYERQQKLLKEKKLKAIRTCCKTNKAEGLYVQHESIGNNGKQMNFNKLLLPAIKAIVTNDELLGMVRDYFNNGVEVETHELVACVPQATLGIGGVTLRS
jgi:hypothetical protein